MAVSPLSPPQRAERAWRRKTRMYPTGSQGQASVQGMCSTGHAGAYEIEWASKYRGSAAHTKAQRRRPRLSTPQAELSVPLAPAAAAEKHHGPAQQAARQRAQQAARHHACHRAAAVVFLILLWLRLVACRGLRRRAQGLGRGVGRQRSCTRCSGAGGRRICLAAQAALRRGRCSLPALAQAAGAAAAAQPAGTAGTGAGRRGAGCWLGCWWAGQGRGTRAWLLRAGRAAASLLLLLAVLAGAEALPAR